MTTSFRRLCAYPLHGPGKRRADERGIPVTERHRRTFGYGTDLTWSRTVTQGALARLDRHLGERRARQDIDDRALGRLPKVELRLLGCRPQAIEAVKAAARPRPGYWSGPAIRGMTRPINPVVNEHSSDPVPDYNRDGMIDTGTFSNTCGGGRLQKQDGRGSDERQR